MTSQEVAKTIMQQLEASFNMTLNGHKVSIFAYLGAKKPLVYSEKSLTFIVPNKKKIIIELNPSDLYNVSLYDYKYFRYDEFIKDIPVEDLKDTIFSMLGVE